MLRRILRCSVGTVRSDQLAMLAMNMELGSNNGSASCIACLIALLKPQRQFRHSLELLCRVLHTTCHWEQASINPLSFTSGFIQQSLKFNITSALFAKKENSGSPHAGSRGSDSLSRSERYPSRHKNF